MTGEIDRLVKITKHAEEEYQRTTRGKEGDRVSIQEIFWLINEVEEWRQAAAMAAQETVPVGGLEIADRLGVKRETVAMWKQRGHLPPARWTVSGEDAWDWDADIQPWAKRTGRLR